MTNSDIIMAESVLPTIDGKGSDRLRLAVAYSMFTIEEIRKLQIKVIKHIRPKSLNDFESKIEEFRLSSKDQSEFSKKMAEWNDLQNYLQQKKSFDDQESFQEWLDEDAKTASGEPVKLTTIDAKVEDLKNIELSSSTIRALRFVVRNADEVIRNYSILKVPEVKEEK